VIPAVEKLLPDNGERFMVMWEERTVEAMPKQVWARAG